MISPQTIELVRERTDIVALVQESVPTLKRRGRSFSGLCPFHNEKSPSFHVNPERGFFHCFGCKESGSAIDFVMKLEGLTFPEAVRALAERAGVEVEEERKGDRTEVDRQKRLKDDLYGVNQLAAVYFEKMLREHPDRRFALDELARRGLKPSWDAALGAEAPLVADETKATFGPIDDTLQAFRIGYAPSGWDGLATFLKQQGISPLVGEQTGLLVPRSSGSGHYDRFRHRLMFAVVDPQGRVVAFSGRALAPTPQMLADKPDAEKPAKYINSPESPVYSKGHALFGLFQARHAIRSAEQAIVVEGNFDVVSLHAKGFTNVVAPLGTAFTVDQAKLLCRFAPTCLVLFDGDAAGRKAIRHSRGPLRDAGVSARVAILPEGVDPDDLVRTRGPTALTDVLARATGLLEFLIEDALEAGFGEADMREKAARVDAVKKLLSEEDDPLVRSLAKAHADRLAGRIDLKVADWRARHVSEEPFRALEQAMKLALAEEAKHRPGPPAVGPAKARISPKPPGSAQRAQIIGALLEYPQLLGDPDMKQALEMLQGLSVRTAAALSQATAGGQKPLDAAAFVAAIPPEVQAFVVKRLAAPEFESLEAAKGEALGNAEKLRGMLVAEDARELTHETARAAGDWNAEVRFAREAAERVRSVKAPARTAPPVDGTSHAERPDPPSSEGEDL